MIYCSDEEFATWAFGESNWNKFMVLELDVIDLMNAWNELHGDEIRLQGDECILGSMEKMKLLWEENK